MNWSSIPLRITQYFDLKRTCMLSIRPCNSELVLHSRMLVQAMQAPSFVDMSEAYRDAVNAFYNAVVDPDDKTSVVHASAAHNFVNTYQRAAIRFQPGPSKGIPVFNIYDAVAALDRCGQVVDFNFRSINKGGAAIVAAAHDIICTACELHAVYHTAAVVHAASLSSIAACNGEAYDSVAGALFLSTDH